MLDSESVPPPVFEIVTVALSDVIGAVMAFAPFDEWICGMSPAVTAPEVFWAARKVSDPPFRAIV
jgi:hypothetical protein